MAELTLLALLLSLAQSLPRVLTAQDLQQSPLYTIGPPGGSVDITCPTSRPLQGVFLKQTWPNNTDVIYYEDGMNATVDQRFQGRVNFTGSQDNLTITMSLLQLADSGIYTCLAVTDRDIVGPGTLVMVTVTEKLCQGTQETHRHQESWLMSLVLPSALAVGFFLLGLGLGMLCVLRKQIRKSCASRDNSQACVVYEDMSYSSCNPGHY